MATIHIAYGICSGPKRARKLLAALEHSGFECTSDIHTADIFIAHSAGCFWLPPASTSQHVVLIDPPYWPGKTIRARLKARARSNLHYRRYGYPLGYWLEHNLLGFYYFAKDVGRHARILKFAPRYDLVSTIAGRHVTIVRNAYDDWLTPDVQALAHNNPMLEVYVVPGDHDDFHYNPEPYMHILHGLR